MVLHYRTNKQRTAVPKFLSLRFGICSCSVLHDDDYFVVFGQSMQVSFSIPHLDELLLDSIAMGTSSQDDELQQEHLMNITTFQRRRRTNEQKSVALYYEELQFANEAMKYTLGDELLSNEERKTMNQTRQIIQMEMESIQSVARNSISSSFAMDDSSPEAQRRVSDAMGIQEVESDPENDQKRTSNPSTNTNTTESSPENEISRDFKLKRERLDMSLLRTARFTCCDAEPKN